MKKLEFLELLKNRLNALDSKEVDKHVSFFAEIIDDHIDDGQSEEEAVSSLGDIDEIVNMILLETPIVKIAKARLNRKALRGWEIALLIIGFPLWFPLLIAAFAVVLSVYVPFWLVIISLWAVFASVVACGFGGIVVGIGFILTGNFMSGIALIGAGLVLAGLSIFLFFGCKAATDGIIWITKKMVLSIKNSFIKKEATK